MYRVDYPALGGRIAAEREKKKLSVESLASRVGVSCEKMEDIESGQIKTLEADLTVLISNALGITMEYLVKGKEFSQ
ncbi:helix-turn-helix domain-containing protein [Eubacteriales bacterium OttesenSCG-928-A19]|nr:helix-turn-helix domain-containing protein [Eubacteriales bacterium OttesenSCG-928-A19]